MVGSQATVYHGRKRRRNDLAPQQVKKFEEIKSRGFPVYVDVAKSNGPDNPTWKSNMDVLANYHLEQREQDGFEEVFRRNRDAFESMTASPEPEMLSSAKGSLAKQGADNNIDTRWESVSTALQLEIFSNLTQRYRVMDAIEQLGIDKGEVGRLVEAADKYNKQSKMEDEAMRFMQRDQLHAILREDHSQSPARMSQESYELITERHLSWIQGGTNPYHVCTQEEWKQALGFLQFQNLDPGLIGEWGTTCLDNSAESIIEEVPSPQASRATPPCKDGLLDVQDSGYVAANSGAWLSSIATATDGQVVLNEKIRHRQHSSTAASLPKQGGAPPKSQAKMMPPPTRKQRQSSPLKNEVNFCAGENASDSTTHRSKKGFPTALEHIKPSPCVTEKQTTRICGESAPRHAPMKTEETIIPAPPFSPMRASSVESGSSEGPARGLRSRDQLRPSRTKLESEETVALLRQRGGGLLDDPQRDGTSSESGRETHNPQSKIIALKLSGSCLARLHARNSVSEPKSWARFPKTGAVDTFNRQSTSPLRSYTEIATDSRKSSRKKTLKQVTPNSRNHEKVLKSQGLLESRLPTHGTLLTTPAASPIQCSPMPKDAAWEHDSDKETSPGTHGHSLSFKDPSLARSPPQTGHVEVHIPRTLLTRKRQAKPPKLLTPATSPVKDIVDGNNAHDSSGNEQCMSYNKQNECTSTDTIEDQSLDTSHRGPQEPETAPWINP